MIYAPKISKMVHSKMICKNTLFITNVYLQSYIQSNVNALVELGKTLTNHTRPNIHDKSSFFLLKFGY